MRLIHLALKRAIYYSPGCKARVIMNSFKDIVKKIFDTCAIIGPGLIGGSIGLGLKQKNLVGKVIGVGYRQASIDNAIKLGAIDCGFLNITDEVLQADLIIIATPVSMIPLKFKEIVPRLNSDTIITDVGSTKQSILDEFNKIYAESEIDKSKQICFIGAHPIAGSENSGVDYAVPDLFANSICVLTPSNQENESFVDRLEEMWQTLGSDVIKMSAEEHDGILSSTSHLPQVIAFSVANTIKKEHWKFSGGGLKDLTRIASSDPKLWQDICTQNSDNIVKSIDLFIHELLQVRDAIKENRNDEILEVFKRAKNNHDGYYKKQ